MIITAKVAQLLASNEMREEPKYGRSIRQLNEIEKTINSASRQGKKAINYYKDLYPGVYSALILNWYKVSQRSSWDYGGDFFEISWEEWSLRKCGVQQY